MLDLLITLSPSMPHFHRFATDDRLSGIRINSAMMELDELDNEFNCVKLLDDGGVPLWYDIKGRQLRVRKVGKKTDCLRMMLNHKIEVDLPTVVLFKAGEDNAILEEIVETDDGQVLVFRTGGPQFGVKPGESICIRHPSFKVLSDTFPDYEIEKIRRVRASGLFSRYVLSYVESQRDIDQFRELVGHDCEIIAKIENRKGLDWVASGWRRQDGVSLMAARGDLYIEVEKPHEILNALKLIVDKDPEAMVGSRILLSCVRRVIPDAVDFSELAWLYDIGYRKMMLCDDLCIQEQRLAAAVNAFCAFRSSYAREPEIAQDVNVSRSFLKFQADPVPKKKPSWLSSVFGRA